jgi:hypothetical protein
VHLSLQLEPLGVHMLHVLCFLFAEYFVKVDELVVFVPPDLWQEGVSLNMAKLCFQSLGAVIMFLGERMFDEMLFLKIVPFKHLLRVREVCLILDHVNCVEIADVRNGLEVILELW